MGHILWCIALRSVGFMAIAATVALVVTGAMGPESSICLLLLVLAVVASILWMHEVHDEDWDNKYPEWI